jgi:hypothetical protein
LLPLLGSYFVEIARTTSSYQKNYAIASRTVTESIGKLGVKAVHWSLKEKQGDIRMVCSIF